MALTFRLILVFTIIVDSCLGEFWFENEAFVESIISADFTRLNILKDDTGNDEQKSESYNTGVRIDAFGFNETLTSANVFLAVKLSDKLFRISSNLCPTASKTLSRIMQDVAVYTYIRRLQPERYMSSFDYFNYGIKKTIKLLEQCEKNPPRKREEASMFLDKTIVRFGRSNGSASFTVLEDLTKCSDIRQWFKTKRGQHITIPGRIAFESLWGSYLITYFACSPKKQQGQDTWRYYDLMESIMLGPFVHVWANPDMPIRRALHVFKLLDEFERVRMSDAGIGGYSYKIASSENYKKLSACASQMFFRTNASPYPCFIFQSDKFKEINVQDKRMYESNRANKTSSFETTLEDSIESNFSSSAVSDSNATQFSNSTTETPTTTRKSVYEGIPQPNDLLENEALQNLFSQDENPGDTGVR